MSIFGTLNRWPFGLHKKRKEKNSAKGKKLGKGRKKLGEGRKKIR